MTTPDRQGPAAAEEIPRTVRTPVLARVGHDRIGHRRRDETWVAGAWALPTSRVLLLDADSRALTDGSGALALLPPSDAAERIGTASDRVLLGERDGVAYFALLAHPDSGPRSGSDSASDGTVVAEGDWRGLRELGLLLDDLQVGLLTAGVALQQWHQRHTHCPRCGAATAPSQAGWTRRCVSDGSEHFPRTDPAVIMLITDDRDRCLLARSPGWPEGRMSVLAGFVEAGESAEAAVAREVGEEVGIAVRDVRYIASQPHPFPASLMLGFTARVDGDSTLHPDQDEIAEAGWFTREQVRSARDWGAESSAQQGVLRGVPSEISIARQLIDTWISSEVSAGAPTPS